MNTTVRERARKAPHVRIDAELLEHAERLKIDVSEASEQGLARAVASRQAAEWLARNQAALTSSNAFVDKHGLPLARHRNF